MTMEKKLIRLYFQYNVSGLGSQCNQAIMLLTNGPQETYEEVRIRLQANWLKKKNVGTDAKKKFGLSTVTIQLDQI
jgi:hypothetical protein